jgi:hypothetical protein
MNNEVIQEFLNGEKKGINKSTVYLLPMLGLHESDFRGPFPNNLFQNCFIKDNTLDPDSAINKNKILLRYRFSGKIGFQKLDKKLTIHPDFFISYEIDKYHTMYVYNIPIRWEQDYQKFINWQPSKFSKDYKEHIIRFYGSTPMNKLYKVLHKSEELFIELDNLTGTKVPRDLEASSIPYFEEIEYFREEFKVKGSPVDQPNYSFETEDDGN